jgi:hypothetical protein
MERHYSVICSEVQSWLTEIGHEDYSSRKAGLKKEIPDITLDLDRGFATTQQMLVASWVVNDRTYSTTTPEPSALLLLGSGVLLVAATLQRKFNAEATT